MDFLGVSTSILLGIRFRCLEPDSPFPPARAKSGFPFAPGLLLKQLLSQLEVLCFTASVTKEGGRTLLENLNCFSSLSSRGKKWVTSLLEHGELVARQPVLLASNLDSNFTQKRCKHYIKALWGHALYLLVKACKF